MARPILLAVDDDVNVLEAVVQDLRREYGSTYRVMRAASGQAGLDTLEQLKTRQEAVALIVSDQRMPGMTGVEFLERARGVYSDARRVLLTAYADTEAAIQAINSARIHYYLNKPWDPPEEKLYPVLSDLLEDWKAGYQPPFEGLRVIGHRWSLNDHRVRTFLSSNHVPYRWLDIATSEDARKLLEERHLDADKLPVVLFGDGSALADPELNALAARVGLSIQATQEFYDIVVVGAGPAGLAAAVYGASEGLRTLVIEPQAPGGQAGSSSRIENYLGFPSGMTGADLGRRAHVQATRFGAEFVTSARRGCGSMGNTGLCSLPTGAKSRATWFCWRWGCTTANWTFRGRIGCRGKGIYYGAALVEAVSCKDEDVYVVGGANSAGQAALYFARYARKVTMLVRGPGLTATMSKYLIDEIGKTSNIELEAHTQIVEAFGEERLEAIAAEGSRWANDGFRLRLCLCLLGQRRDIGWLPGSILRDDHGFLLAGPDLRIDGKPPNWQEPREPFLLESSVPGIFVAGDVRHGSVKRVASAVGEGSIAVQFAHQYLAGF